MHAFLSSKANNRIISALRERGFDVILLQPSKNLDMPVSTHADMLLLAVDNTLFIHKDYPLIDPFGFERIIRIDERMEKRYPYDVLLNIAIVGKNVFANTKHASKTVLEHLERHGYHIHHVSQGYAHCSCLTVGDNALITADKGIAIAAQNNGVDALLINEGYISLPPYQYGFIGGASGSVGDSIYLCGSLEGHPDKDKIIKFCNERKKQIVELCDIPLCDIGGILFIE